MNSVIMAQAEKLSSFDLSNDTEAHMFLERMLIAVDIQDQVIQAVFELKSRNLVQVGACIEQAMHSSISDFLKH
ncbi:hypothetical protein C2869_16130 [Saccharobesus litoralis]|uniref:Uncharacterized protein n=1 Tax=Saccharobesus litoralis TaxID=2172099 RepID=A0A2S0VUT8_9ALTE|nr:hypothetical protein [Saccharobesus litoralis]AWB67860.1 hypothetical protein C2869_16130 [Saccharobesus litoralis]